jgi:hypothetical protein
MNLEYTTPVLEMDVDGTMAVWRWNRDGAQKLDLCDCWCWLGKLNVSEMCQIHQMIDSALAIKENEMVIDPVTQIP